MLLPPWRFQRFQDMSIPDTRHSCQRQRVFNVQIGNGFKFDLILASFQGCLFFITEMVLGHNDLVPGENMTEYQKWLGELHRKSPCWGVQSWFLGINIRKQIVKSD